MPGRWLPWPVKSRASLPAPAWPSTVRRWLALGERREGTRAGPRGRARPAAARCSKCERVVAREWATSTSGSSGSATRCSRRHSAWARRAVVVLADTKIGTIVGGGVAGTGSGAASGAGAIGIGASRRPLAQLRASGLLVAIQVAAGLQRPSSHGLGRFRFAG